MLDTQQVQPKGPKTNFAKNSEIARAMLKKSIPLWLKEGWTLNPAIIKKGPDGRKKLTFLTQDGTSGPRIVIKSPDDLPPTANAVLGTSQTKPVLDIDIPNFKLPDDFPLPYKIVETGKYRHLYFLNGDIKESVKLTCGDLQFKTTGVFMPGSYHAPSGKFYKELNCAPSTDKLYMSHLKPLLRSKNQLQGRFHTQQKTTFAAMQNGSQKGVFEAYHKAREAGQTPAEAYSVAGPSLAKMEVIPTPTEPPKGYKTVTNTKPEIIKPKHFVPIVKPRTWLFNEKIFLKGRDNQLIGEPGVGKSSLSRYIASRYLKALLEEKNKGAVILFAQEDDQHEDIAPYFVKYGHKEGAEIKNLYVVTNWQESPPIEVLKEMKHIKNKLIILDPVHSLFKDVRDSSQCRKEIQEFSDAKADGDTSIIVNHPKPTVSGVKLSGADIGASSRQIGYVCRSSAYASISKDTGLSIVEHSKRQLKKECYTYRLVEEIITNKDKEECSLSWIEDFKVVRGDKAVRDAGGVGLIEAKTNLSKKREQIRNEILSSINCIGDGKPVKKASILQNCTISIPDLKPHDFNREIRLMTDEGLLERSEEWKERLYRCI